MPQTKDPMAVYERAMTLFRHGCFEDALDDFAWLQGRHAEIDASFRPLQHSYALAGWAMLGKSFDPARAALAALLQARIREQSLMPGDPGLAEQIAAIELHLASA